MTNPQKRIALVLEVAVALRYPILQGVRDYARGRKDWTLLRNSELSVMDWRGALASGPHGIIGVVRENDQWIVREAPVPFVCVNNECELPGIVRVRSDAHAAGVMAGEYLVGRGFHQFAYCTHVPNHNYSRLRWKGYVGMVRKAGFQAFFMDLTTDGSPSREIDCSSVGSLPRPGAVYCVNDLCARHVLNFCEANSIKVPDDLAVLGTDNDVLYCEDGEVMLSSIELNHRAVGYRAAQVLDAMLEGGPRPTAPVLIPPAMLVARASTESSGNIHHPIVRMALRIIEDRFHDSDFTAAVLAKHCRVSARTLGRTFAAEGLPSPYHVLLQERVRHAKRLLVETKLTAGEIAYRSGFTEYSSLYRAFKRLIGCSPSEFRDPGALA